jgi:hypothetical protein
VTLTGTCNFNGTGDALAMSSRTTMANKVLTGGLGVDGPVGAGADRLIGGLGRQADDADRSCSTRR